MTKYPRYQDYVIRDGRFVGEFEQMYQDFDDPWHQTVRERFASEKAAGLELLSRLKDRHGIQRVLELGCGFGNYSARIASLGLDVVGIDISETAIAKARTRYRNVEFLVGNVVDFSTIKQAKPDVIIMSEVSWYILEHLQNLVHFLRNDFRNAYLLHMLNIYPPGIQRYGLNYFSNLDEIKQYFGMRYLESGLVNRNTSIRTWFLGTWNKDTEVAWYREE